MEIKIDKDEIARFIKEYRRPNDTQDDPSIFQPVEFGYTVDYAESLEYGTGPLRIIQPTVHSGNYTYEYIWDGLNEWAKRKLHMMDDAYRENFVTGVANRMWDVGMYPHPYFRPALQWLEDNLQKLVDEGHSFYEIADETIAFADHIIMISGLPDLGNLQDSAKVNSLNFDETYVKSQERINDDDKRDRFDTGLKKVGWE